MKTIKVLAVCLFVIGGIAFIKYRSVSKAIAEHSKFSLPPESVTALVAKEETWQDSLVAISTISAAQGITLSAEEAGKVVKINFESGATVKAGDVLVELDTTTEQAQLRSAQAKLELAQANFARGKTLRPTNAVSQSDMDTWTFQAKQFEADAAAIRSTMAKKTIVAPFSGKAGIRMVNIGQFLRQGDPVVPLHALDPLYVNFTIPQQQLSEVKEGQSVLVGIDAFPNDTFAAKVTAINPQVDSSTRNGEIQATLPNPEEKIRPGMFANVSILLNKSQKVIPMPGSSVNYAPYGNSVYVIESTKNQEGKDVLTVRQQFVKIGPTRGDQVAILLGEPGAADPGLKPGDQVVTSGTFKLRPGGQVLINNTVTPGNNPNPKPADT